MPAMIPKMIGTSQISSGTKNSRPQVMTARTQPTTPAMAQVIWWLRAPTACARTVGDSFPLVMYAIRGATQPRIPPPMSTPAAPPKCAIRAQFFSSAVAYPGGGMPGPVTPTGE